MTGKGKGSNYSVTRQEYYKRKRGGVDQMEYTLTVEQALEEAGLT